MKWPFRVSRLFWHRTPGHSPVVSGSPAPTLPNPEPRTLISPLLLAFSLIAVACSLPAPALEPAEQLQFAEGLYARGMWDTALKEYQAFLAVNADRKEDLPLVYFRIGGSLRSLGRTNEAMEAFQKAYAVAASGEYHDRAGLSIADIREQAGDVDGEIQILKEIIGGSPIPELAAASRYMLGMIYEKQGKIREASASYEAVITQVPDNVYVSYAALALAGLDRKSGGTRAVELYRKAAASPASPRVGAEAWFQLGELYFARKEFGKSAEAYGQLANLYPQDERVAQARLQRAWALYYDTRFAEALAVCESASAEWLYLKANCERQVMKNDHAIASYGELLATYPNSPLAASAAYERALVLYKQGRFAEAITQGRGLVSNEKVRRDVCWLLAESCAAVKDDAGAVQYYRMLIDQYPASPLAGDALYRLANMLQKKGDYLQAAELFDRLATGFPAHDLAAQALFAEAASWGKALKHEQAVATYARLLEKYPASSFVEEALYLKATTETFLRRDANARETWRELAERFPKTKYAADAGFWNGVLLEEAGKLEEAESAFRSALKAKPAPADELVQRIRFRLALVLQRRGTQEATEAGRARRDEAADLLLKLMDTPLRAKFPPALLEWLGEIQLGARAYDKAAGVADLMTTQANDDRWKQIAWCLKGKALMGQGKAEAARESFERVLGFSVKSQAMAEAWLKLGELALAGKDADKARRAFEEAATLAADDALLPVRVRAYAGIGRALKSQGDLAGAARHFMSVAVLFDDPDLVPECLYEATAAFTALGRKDDAAKSQKELKDRYPDSEWARK